MKHKYDHYSYSLPSVYGLLLKANRSESIRSRMKITEYSIGLVAYGDDNDDDDGVDDVVVVIGSSSFEEEFVAISVTGTSKQYSSSSSCFFFVVIDSRSS